MLYQVIWSLLSSFFTYEVIRARLSPLTYLRYFICHFPLKSLCSGWFLESYFCDQKHTSLVPKMIKSWLNLIIFNQFSRKPEWPFSQNCQFNCRPIFSKFSIFWSIFTKKALFWAWEQRVFDQKISNKWLRIQAEQRDF